MIPNVYMLFGGGWSCKLKIESPFLEAHRAHLGPRVSAQPSAVWMLRMVAAYLGSTAPSTRDIVNHLLFYT